MTTTLDTAPDYTERVARGAAFLDSYGPADWANKIDPDRLNLQSARSCVLGQLYGGFNAAVHELFDGHYDAAAHFGFSVTRETAIRLAAEMERDIATYFAVMFGMPNPVKDEYTLLTNAWRSYIAYRRCAEYADHFAALDAAQQLATV